MSTIVVAVTFTKSSGQPATGLTLAQIALYLTSINNATGAVGVVWDGTQIPTVEVTNTGTYVRLYTGADLATYSYVVSATYSGITVLDSDYAVGAVGRVESTEIGAGAIAFTYTLTSSVDGTAIADADVWATSDAAGNTILASGHTDSAGQVVFYLDAGNAYIWRQKSGYNFTNPDTEIVA
jgi:hypothetical protein